MERTIQCEVCMQDVQIFTGGGVSICFECGMEYTGDGEPVDVAMEAATQLVVGSVFEDSNENVFKVIQTDRGYELLEDGEVLLEDEELYIFDSLQDIENMFNANDNPIELLEEEEV